MKNLKIILNLLLLAIILQGCGVFKKVDSSVPIQGEDRARKNIEEGRGVSLKNLARGGSTTYEFSSSNPMWRASLEILDFLPLLTVDYSGGIIITDWYNDSVSSNETLKITIRFLSNDIAASNLKIIIHQKKCSQLGNCSITEINSIIKDELYKSILKKAAQLELESKNKKK